MSRKRPIPVEDRRTGNPAEQIRLDLERFRAVGRSFDEAWRMAFIRARWPHVKEERDFWKGMLTAQRHLYEASYYGQAQPERVTVFRRLESVEAA